MHTRVNVSKQDIEDAIEQALGEFKREHSKTPTHLAIGRLAYEEFRDMSRIGQPGGGIPTRYKNLEVVVLEEPADILTIGCKPD